MDDIMQCVLFLRWLFLLFFWVMGLVFFPTSSYL